MPLGVGFAQRLNEVTQVITMTYHQMEIAFLVAGGHVQRLPASQWRCVQEAGAVYGRVAQEATIQGEDSLRERATRENLIRFLDPDLAAFQRATSEVIAERVRAGDFPQSLVDRIAAIR
jgi:TRAP-type C4-dicarboxylate transport system substrate-binding protein